MPIYEYQCANCHHQFDLIQKISDEPVKQCPKCFQNTLNKLVSAAGFQLKGTGWYVTDFKNKSGASTTQTDTKKDTPLKDNKINTSDEVTKSTKGDTE